MSNLKSYVGSILLATLLLQGCGGATDATTQNSSDQASAVGIQAEKTIVALTEAFADLNASSTDDEVAAAVRSAKLNASSSTSTQTSQQTAGLISNITDKVKDGLVNILDTKLGDKVTSAAFDVVLNSEGVTVVAIDLARGSQTISEIMVNAMEGDWSLASKMCPMLRRSSEFGEKFTALAEEREIVGRFFFERIDAQMYGCLTDAMLLSNNDAVHDGSVSHSTNGYMAILMDRYATDYFITPTGSNADRRNDKFVSLLLDTGAITTYDSETKTFTGHGDANELTNEKFFYSIFKTPTTTDAFVSAMDKVDVATRTMLMDNIFLGNTQNNDTIQGNLNIIAIGSAMYDGIYGVANTQGVRSGEYGFSSYAGAFIGFAGLIPGDRYMTYAKAFVGAGYQYASFHGINVWTGISDAAKLAWDTYTGSSDTSSTASGAPARSGGLGIIGSDWVDDITDLLFTAYDNFEITIDWVGFYYAITGDKSILEEISDQVYGLKDEADVAYRTIIDGRDENNLTAYPTEISNGAVHNDTVYGLHGLVQLAIQEDIYYVECGNRSTDYIGLDAPTCETNSSYTIENAKAAFTLPPFADITWSYAYGTAKDGVMTYYDRKVDAEWFANLSSNELIRQYFYPSADNIYIPNWLLAVDWLSAPANFANTNVADTDFSFNAGYFDIYVTSTNDALFTVVDENNVTINGSIDLVSIVGLIKTIEVTKVDMGNDDIIAVDETGQNIDGLYVYKIRAITPEDTQLVINTVTAASSYAIGAIGLDSSNASNIDTTNASISIE